MPELDQILDVGIQAAEALQHAHQRHVIHRDVKPANLILDSSERVWLTDFGLARRLIDAGATMTGVLMGTPRYMSPEQADLQTTEIDQRSDVYSLGATLYEMACGEPPHSGNDPLNLITKIRYEEPADIRSIRPSLPRDFQVVLQKAMEKDPPRRYQTAGQFAEDLRAIRDDHPIQARPLSLTERAARFSRKHQTRLQAAAIAMIAAIALTLVTMTAINKWIESQNGRFRIRTGGGPYQALIVPAGESALSDSVVEATLPMQNFRALPSGDYNMMVAPLGKWSRNVSFPVSRGDVRELSLSRGKKHESSISIVDALAVAVNANKHPAIVWRHDGLLKRIGWEEDQSWQIRADAIETDLVNLDDSDGEQSGRKIGVNYARTRIESGNLDRGQLSLDDDPVHCHGDFVLQDRVDLDGDDKADTVIAATDRQAIAALDATGKLLWSRAFEFAGQGSQTLIPNYFDRRVNLPFPGVFHLQSVGDLDRDGVVDLFAMLAHVQLEKRTDVCFLILSGKTGTPLDSVQQQLKFTPNQFWPADGVFAPEQQKNRPDGLISESNGQLVHNGSVGRWEFRLRQRANSWPLKIALPSRPHFLRHGGMQQIVSLQGDRCYIIPIGRGVDDVVTIKLPFFPPHAPRVTEFGDEVRLIFHDHEESSDKSGRLRGTEMVAYDLGGNQVWQKRLADVDWSGAVDRNHVDWPLLSDLNDDGIDELILPRTPERYQHSFGVDLCDAITGTPLWPKDLKTPVYRSLHDGISRIVVTEDLDDDGWREIAIASLSGESQPDDATQETMFLYVNWISGRTGHRLSWARHRFSSQQTGLRVAQADAIRSRLPGARQGTVEVDLVFGTYAVDSNLASQVVRFHPSSPGPIEIANGLDVCPVNNKQDAVQPESSVRVYRRRGGPYSVGEDELVLLEHHPQPNLRLGESRIIASWTEGNMSLIAAYDHRDDRVCVFEADRLRTVWQTQATDDSDVECTPIMRNDGTFDLLLQYHRNGTEISTDLHDGVSGTKICSIEEPLSGAIIFQQTTEDDTFAVLVGNGRWNPHLGGKRRDSFRMASVSLKTGVARWSVPILHLANRVNRPGLFGHLRVTDLNGDGVDDVIGSDSHDEKLYLAAWNGLNGEKLWERYVFQRPPRTDYWIPFTLASIEGKKHVVYLGKPDEDAKYRALVLCSSDGELVATQALKDPQQLYLSDFEYSSANHCLENISASGDGSQIGLARLLGGKYASIIYDISAKQFEITSEQVYNWDESVDRMWIKDADGDGRNDRLVITRARQNQDSSLPGESNPGTKLVVRRFQIDKLTPDFEFTLPDVINMQSHRWHGEADRLVGWHSISAYHGLTIDWTNGKLLYELKEPQAQFAYRPSFFVSQVERGREMIAVPTRDGVEIREVGPIAQRQKTPVELHPHQDPRRQRNLFERVGIQMTLAQMLWTMIDGLIAVSVMVLLPVWYLKRSVTERQWSLSWLLLLPCLVGLWIVFWQNRWDTRVQLILDLLNGAVSALCLATLYLTIRASHDKHGYSVRRMVIIGTPFIFTLMIMLCYFQRGESDLHYAADWQDYSRAGILSFFFTAQIYWALRIVAVSLTQVTRRLRGLVAS